MITPLDDNIDLGSVRFVSYTALRITPTIIAKRANWRRAYIALVLLVIDGAAYLPRATLHYWAHVLTCSLPGCVHRWVEFKPRFEWR